MAHESKYLSVTATAARFGVPLNWLRREAEQGRVPHLHAGRRLLFNPVEVERVLLERARANGGEDA